MRTKRMRLTFFIAILAAAGVFAQRTHGAQEPERLIVKCERPCLGVETTVRVIGGEVTYAYENVDAIAVAVPAERVPELSDAVGADAIRKDVEIERPVPMTPLEAGSVVAEQPLVADALDSAVKSLPANYNYNNALTGSASLHAQGLLGRNVVVAVIDTGVQIAAGALGPIVGGTVIGGENLVPLATDPVASATSRLNDWHGTSVSNMIAAHANFVFLNTSTLVQSLRVHSPSSVVACPGPPFDPACPETASIIPMIGQAPAAKVYALKVFSSRGGGSPESRVIAAMDRAITLRRHFNEGMPVTPIRGSGTEDDPYAYDSLDIEVVNMSLGGPTLFAGHDLQDELTEAMLEVGIVITVAAGNAGFGAMTVESPGSGFGALAVAAANTPVHERVLRDQQLGLGGGVVYRPSNDIQTAYFSSRGPLADGRTGPHLIANGFASYTNAFAALTSGNAVTSCGALNAVAGSCLSRILFVSGTSFSTPTVAGAAALLRGAVPAARAEKVRKALIRGADKRVLGDWSSPFDQGAGFLDVPASLALLNSALPGTHDDCDDEADDVGVQGCRERERGDRHDDGPDEVGAGGRSVIRNVKKAGLSIVQFKDDQFSQVVKRLRPGQVQQFFIPSDARTDRLTIRITDVVPEGPQNTLFGDDFFVMGLDAPTSFAVHRINVPATSEGAFVTGDTTFVIDNPQTGLFRLALQGDWTNGGVISGRVVIERERNRLGPATATGPIEQDDLIPVFVNIPAGVSQAVFELFWQQNWGRYPTNDLDMLVIRPDGTLFVDATGLPPGAGFSSPERVVVPNPAAGNWIVLVNGFTIHDTGKGPRTGRDEFTLRVTADGRPISTN